MEIVALFRHVDDFWQQFEPAWRQRLIASGKRQCVREGRRVGVR